MKVTLVCTVLNEEATIAPLLDSILAQTRPPDEVIIVDGGSRDRTVEVLRAYQDRLPLQVLLRPGANISTGRNAAIKAATSEVIACTDAGVRLSPNWLESLAGCFDRRPRPGLACGFFAADPRTAFEAALGATSLPNIDEIDPARFLPSSRSVAVLRAAWESVGGYPEWLDYCEDLVFDFKMKRAGYPFAWAPDA
ncbi:MAG: glycosyltransferase, partial [Dehalococcoidia bacterium]|nr:glycosyltransferase [Dehalococcoidia bacterium]